MTLTFGFLLFGSKLGLAEYWIYFTGQFAGVHAFGYNAAKSEPIWMKSGALLSTLLGRALADFGRDPRSSDSLRGRLNFFVR